MKLQIYLTRLLKLSCAVFFLLVALTFKGNAEMRPYKIQIKVLSGFSDLVGDNLKKYYAAYSSDSPKMELSERNPEIIHNNLDRKNNSSKSEDKDSYIDDTINLYNNLTEEVFKSFQMSILRQGIEVVDSNPDMVILVGVEEAQSSVLNNNILISKATAIGVVNNNQIFKIDFTQGNSQTSLKFFKFYKNSKDIGGILAKKVFERLKKFRS